MRRLITPISDDIAMSASISNKENRRIQRIGLSLPVRIEVTTGRFVTWREDTQSTDISVYGVGIMLKRPVQRGRIVCLTIPMPKTLRQFDYDETDYHIWGLVRRCIGARNPTNDHTYSAGIAFIGKQPPESFVQHPSRLYDIPFGDPTATGFWRVTDADSQSIDGNLKRESRKETRFEIPEELIVDFMDETGDVIASEKTVTENISRGGAVIFTNFSADPGAFLRVTSERNDLEIISMVRSQREAHGGSNRLHLEFIDRLFPLEGIV